MLKKSFLVCVGALSSMGAMSQVAVSRDYSSVNQGATTMGGTKSSSLVAKFGIKAGVNMSTMNDDMDFDPRFSNGVGFRVGGLVNLRWGQRTESSMPGTGWFGIQPEIMYSYQAVKTDGGDMKFNYISVPIMLKFYPTTSLSIEVGPEFNYLIASSPSEWAADGVAVSVGDCKGLNMGIGAGAAYEFNGGFCIGARYSLGLTDMAENLKWKNNNVQVSLGWMF